MIRFSWVRIFSLCIFGGVFLRLALIASGNSYFSQVATDIQLRGVFLGLFYDSLVLGTIFLVLSVFAECGRLIARGPATMRAANLLMVAFACIFMVAGICDLVLFQYLNTKFRLSLILNNIDQLGPILGTIFAGGTWTMYLWIAVLPIIFISGKKTLAKIPHVRMEILQGRSGKERALNFIFFLIVSFAWVEEPFWRLEIIAAQPEPALAIGNSGLYLTASDLGGLLRRRAGNKRLIPYDQTGPLFEKYFGSVSQGVKKSGITLINSPAGQKPNVVIILMEYMGAFLSKELTPDGPGVTPELDELASESVFFTKAYSSSTRTHHGLVSVISGFPSILDSSAIRTRNGLKIPTLATALPDYDSTFLYSGDIRYDHMNSFAIQGDFKNLVGDKELLELNPQWASKRNEWGYPDELLFDYLNRRLENLYNQGTPSLTVVLTTSNHEPFQLPDAFYAKHPELKRNTIEAAGAYAASAIGKFFKTAKEEAYYKNTIFVLVADHSRMRKHHYGFLKGFHIPLLIHSPLLKGSAKKIDSPANQIDIPSTVMGLLGRSFSSFDRFGHDLLAENSARRAFSISRDGNNLVYTENDFGVRLNLSTESVQFIQVDKYANGNVVEASQVSDKTLVDSYPERAKVFLQRTTDALYGSGR